VRIANQIISFSEVNGLTIQHDEQVYRHGLSESKGFIIQRGFAKPINISLKKGMMMSSKEDNQAINNFLFEAFSKNKKFDIDIDLCDDAGTALFTWKVIGAVPLKYELPSLQANSNEVSIESIDLLARKLLIDKKENAVL
jgi:phage tail-like protein